LQSIDGGRYEHPARIIHKSLQSKLSPYYQN
jgi:hypothetical protein